MEPIAKVRAMTPVECMKLQLDRGFSCTLGCGELESIGRKVLLDLCLLNRWDSWLRKSDYTSGGRMQIWKHSHWCGNGYYDCEFEKFIEYHSLDGNLFKVNQSFIDAMHFAENV